MTGDMWILVLMGVNEITKETVVSRTKAGWSFHLPAQHKIEVDHENNVVSLSTPLERSVYHLAGITETDDEVIVELGALSGTHGTGMGENAPEAGYSLPQIHEEFDRLHGRWTQAGLSEHDFQAYATGSTR